MKRVFLSVLGVCMMAGALARAAERQVFTDLDEAKVVAAREGKQLVIEFFGRAWCPPCQALVRDVMGSAEFAAFASERVVVHLDYPRKSERTAEKVDADPALAKLMAAHAEYKVEGFPTIVLLDARGAEVGRVLGYDPGSGPIAFLAELTGMQ